jgi:hypothetical protein
MTLQEAMAVGFGRTLECHGRQYRTQSGCHYPIWQGDGCVSFWARERHPNAGLGAVHSIYLPIADTRLLDTV